MPSCLSAAPPIAEQPPPNPADQTAAGTDSAAVAAAADAASDDRSAEQRDSLAGAAGDAQGKMANGQETAASAANLGGAPDFDDDDDAPDFDDETTPRDKWGGAAGQPAAAGSDPAPPDVAQVGARTPSSGPLAPFPTAVSSLVLVSPPIKVTSVAVVIGRISDGGSERQRRRF